MVTDLIWIQLFIVKRFVSREGFRTSAGKLSSHKIAFESSRDIISLVGRVLNFVHGNAAEVEAHIFVQLLVVRSIDIYNIPHNINTPQNCDTSLKRNTFHFSE